MTDSWPQVLYSDGLREKLASAKVLAVGAGGIGCELLKTLVLSGFRNVEAVDMDTIETSNLNRQFLFRRRHVGESKAKVAAEAVSKLAPSANIVAHQANIKESRFNVDYFKSFSLVLNGLDNLDARRHVNRMCIAAGVPLVESGTAGYLGQVTVHLRGVSECFECTPKPTPKTYPVCTIRNTPDKPIHCVVWAKELLFQRLFGKQETASDMDAGADGVVEGAGDDDAAPEDLSVYSKREEESSAEYAERVFDRVFGEDIDTLRSMEDMWTSRAKPRALYLSSLLPGWSNKNGSEAAANKENKAAPNGTSLSSACKSLGLTDHYQVWSESDNARVFLEAVRLFHDTRTEDLGHATFDKDDDLAVEFVTAAANLRCACYAITQQNLFDTKGMAGNIIHAIATTNAIISGLIVNEAIKILAGLQDQCKDTFLLQHSSNGKLLVTTGLPPPKPDCLACGAGQAHVTINTATTTFKTFIDKLLKSHLGAMCPSLMYGEFMYEEGEDLEEDEVEFNQQNLPKLLKDLPDGGIVHGSILSVQDQLQQHHFTVVISHKDDISEEDHPEGFIVSGGAPQPKQEAANTDQPGPFGEAGPSGVAGDADDDDDLVLVEGDEDDVILMDTPEPVAAPDNGKRPVEDSHTPPKAKRQKTAAGGVGDEPIVLD